MKFNKLQGFEKKMKKKVKKNLTRRFFFVSLQCNQNKLTMENVFLFNDVISLPNISQYSFLRTVRKKGKHYVSSMKLGYLFPDLHNKNQILNFIKHGRFVSLGKSDVLRIENILKQHGFFGMYYLPNSNANYCCLSNLNQFKQCLKKLIK